MGAAMNNVNKITFAMLVFSFLVLVAGPMIWTGSETNEYPNALAFLVGLATLSAWVFSLLAMINFIVGLVLHIRGRLDKFWISLYTANVLLLAGAVFASGFY